MIVIYVKSIALNIINAIIMNILLTILMILINSYINRKQDKNYFYRERPKNLSVAIINYYYKGKITKDTIWLTLLDLISKGYYKLDKINNEYSITWQKDELLDLDNYDLNSFEKEIANYINVILIEKNSKKINIKELKNMISSDIHMNIFVGRFYGKLKSEIKRSFGMINKEKNYIFIFMLTYLYYFLVFNPSSIMGFLLGILYTTFIVCLSIMLKNIQINLKGVMSIILILYFICIFIIPFIPTIIKEGDILFTLSVIINPILILVNILIIKINFYTKNQEELVKEINGLKNFLTEFSRLSEKDLKYIILFKQYYAFAIALDVKIEDIIPDKFEYDDNELSSLTSAEFMDFMSDIAFKLYYK